MSELTKTICFVLGACAAVGAAWIGRPATVGVAPPGAIGKPLFEQFDNPDAAKQMEVVEFDGELGQLSTFRVAQKNGSWVIPSHNDYPADAQENLAEAATVLVGLEVVNYVSDKKNDHVTYGVVKPDADKVSLGDDGVGKLISMKDESGRKLAELVIGKEVQGQTGQRYVRAGDIDRVYIVNIDPAAMSTKFEDWIERDVLQLQAMDITNMTIRDYSTSPEMTQRGGLTLNDQQRLALTVSWDETNFKWELEELLELKGNELKPSSLLEFEQLDKEALDGMKNALDDLKIVDVERKPAGLGAGLKAKENFWKDDEGIRSLFKHGFYPVQMPDGAMKLRSSDGEVEVRTKGGVKYLFRFGQVAGIEQGSEESKLNRFVMVTAGLDDSVFAKPEPPAAAETDGDKDVDLGKSGQLDGSDATDDEEAASDTVEPTDGESSDTVVSADEVANGPNESKDGAGPSDSAESQEALKQYAQALDDYNEQIAQSQKRVDELNYRFSDWYYVITEDEYKKIHLRRADVITEKESTVEEGNGLDALRKLESDGLNREPDEAAPAAP